MAHGKRLKIESGGVIYDSIADACKHMFVSSGSLNRAIRQGETECLGVPFKVLGYANVVRNLDTGEVYMTAVEASKKTGVSADLIRRACRGERKRAGGIHWTYEDGFHA